MGRVDARALRSHTVALLWLWRSNAATPVGLPESPCAGDDRSPVECDLVPAPVNERIWHIAFNRTAKVNEQLVRGREAIYFGNEFAVAAAKPLPEYAVRYYVRILRSDRDALRGSFGFYRALDTTIAQNQQRMTRRLTLPVLAIGAQFSFGAGSGMR
jgi:hypothetical protein